MADAVKPIRLIAGLGNPGLQYRGTRHNMGYWLLDAIAEEKGLRFSADTKFFGEVARLKCEQGDIWLLKPTTYMNLSGSAVQAMASYYKISPEEILVVHDELDIAPGCMKIKLGGGNAGHNGLKDITAKLSTPNFWRLRIGIGHPRVFCPQQQVYDWVLGVPEPEHREGMQKCIDAAKKCLENLAKGNLEGVKRTVRKYESLPKPKAEPKPEPESAEKEPRKTAPAETDAARPE